MSAPTVVILAAGAGTRMRSSLPKVLHPLCGRPLVLWAVLAARGAGAARVVVVDTPDRKLEAPLAEHGVVVVTQDEGQGTGAAVRAALPELADDGATVAVLNADVPLFGDAEVRALVAAHEDAGAAATVATMELADPAGYGRIVRGADGALERIVETKAPGDATPEQLLIREVNAGIYAFRAGALKEALGRLGTDNAQGELYLTDTLGLLREGGERVQAHLVDDADACLGVNDRVDLARVRAVAQARIHERHLRAGVTVVDPASTLIDVDVELGADVVVWPSTALRGRTTVGARAELGPCTTVTDCELGDDVSAPHSVLAEARVDAGASVGPFAHLRPGTHLQEGSRAGTFVEVKGSTLGRGARVPHLSYVGDADVGEGANLGASTITANFDGRAKHRTTIGAEVKGGVHVSYVAPVTVGEGATTAAGSAITDDVPPGALAIARARQTTKEGYADRDRD